MILINKTFLLNIKEGGCMQLKRVMAFLLSCLLLAGCAPGVAVEKPKPSEFNKPSLMYQPGRKILAEPKYALKLGVMDVQDKRIVPFWYDADDFFIGAC